MSPGLVRSYEIGAYVLTISAPPSLAEVDSDVGATLSWSPSRPAAISDADLAQLRAAKAQFVGELARVTRREIEVLPSDRASGGARVDIDACPPAMVATVQ